MGSAKIAGGLSLAKLRCVQVALLGVVALITAFMLGQLTCSNESALANEPSDRPSVLVLESGLGDYDRCLVHWLGEDSEELAKKDGLTLATASSPSWWSDAGQNEQAPSTFLLGSPGGESPIRAADIVWALDQIRNSGAEPRAVVVAMGATGLSLREYAEDLASDKQKSRADLVGLVFCGTPQNGYTVMAQYDDLGLWDTIASTIGAKAEDLAPGSSYVSRLNTSALPSVCKVLTIAGSVGDIGFGGTDGLGVSADFQLPAQVSSQVEVADVAATISQATNLTGSWMPYTSEIDHPGNAVDARLVERLSAIDSYETSVEVKKDVASFYDTWFASGFPITHYSSVMLLDLSGSMLESVDGSEDKLSGAKVAAKNYLQTMESSSALPSIAPMDVTIYGFNVEAVQIGEGYGQSARSALDSVEAVGETDIGLALAAAEDELTHAPICAEKRILLLSDGASTQGKTEEEMLAGYVKSAQTEGIAIDAIGFGDVGESNAGFLKRVAKETGGSYYQAEDTYNLQVDFLKAYYSSLGLNLLDEDYPGDVGSATIGAVDERTSALQVGVVSTGDAPELSLRRDGGELDGSQFAVQKDVGLSTLQCLDPPQGEYEVAIEGNSSPMHIFAIKQIGLPETAAIASEQVDYSLYIMAGAVLALVAILAILIARTMGSRRVVPSISAGAGASDSVPRE